jgi:hypothetical protein
MKGSHPARMLFLCNWLAIAFLALVPAPWRSGVVSDCISLITVFFVPGSALALSFSRRDRVPLFELLALGFAINVVLLTATTTLIKFGGIAIDRGVLLCIAAYSLWIALLMFLRSRRLPVIYSDLRLSPPLICVALVSFPLLFTFLEGYTTRGPEQHWLIEQVREVRPSATGSLDPAVERTYVGLGVSRDGACISLERGSCRLLVKNSSGQPKTMSLYYLVAADKPGVFTIEMNGRTDSHPLPQPFSDRGKEVHFQNQAIIKASLALAPGNNTAGLQFRDRSGKNLRCALLDATGLSDRQFDIAFKRSYRLVNFVLMYDIMESKDFADNLLHRPYPYHSTGTPEMPGYAVTNPPMSYIFASFGYALMGGTMAAINKVAFAILTAQFFVALYLMQMGLGRPNTISSAALLIGTLSLATLLTMGVSLHFMTHFMFLCFLLACVFLLERRALPCTIFSLICCCSAWAGYYFCALALICYAIVWREITWPLRRLAVITLCMGAFVAVLLTVGRSQGVLHAWLDILLWENFRRFGAAHLYQAGAKMIFLKYCIPGTALLPLGLIFRRDREANFFLLFSVIYLATLLAAPSNEWKIHYLPTVCIPLMIAGGRGLALAGMAKKNKSILYRAVTLTLTTAASGCFIFLLYLSYRGGLIW